MPRKKKEEETKELKDAISHGASVAYESQEEAEQVAEELKGSTNSVEEMEEANQQAASAIEKEEEEVQRNWSRFTKRIEVEIANQNFKVVQDVLAGKIKASESFTDVTGKLELGVSTLVQKLTEIAKEELG